MNQRPPRALAPLAILAILGSSAVACRGPGSASETSDPRRREVARRKEAAVQFVIDAAQAAVAAVRGEGHDARWDGADPARDLRGTDVGAARAALAALGPQFEVVMTVVELEALAPSDGGLAHLRTNGVVFPGRRLRWGSLAWSEQAGAGVAATQGLWQAAPDLAGAVRLTTEWLGEAPCQLPVLAAAELEALPPSAREDLLVPPDRRTDVCARVRATRVRWEPRVDAMSVVVRGNGRVGLIRTGFEVSGGRVSLLAARARVPQP